MVEHHALRQQVGEWFVVVDQPEIAHHLGPEARVEQVQDGMLDAADVLVDRHPVVGALIDHRRGVIRRAVARVIPGRIDESIHRVGFAPRRLAALRANAVDELGAFGQRIAGTVGHAVSRQLHRQLLIRHGHGATRIAMDQRNRATPVALARDTPVTQAILHLRIAEVFCFQVGSDGGDGSGKIQSVVFAGIHTMAALLIAIPCLPAIQRKAFAIDGDHLLDR